MLTLLECSGTPYSVGLDMGRFGAPAAHDYLVNSSSWHTVMAWRGTDTARRMHALVAERFPTILEELRGLADGLELPFEDVFLWNCRGDLWSMVPDGCTTVLSPAEHGARITHNEDGDPAFSGHCGVGLFQPDNGPDFASFLYPASIPGHTFAVNQHGLACTVNNVRAREIVPGVPRMVLMRALLNQPTLDEGIALLTVQPKCGGFHLSLAQRGRDTLMSVEFNSHGVSSQPMAQAGLHANHLLHPSMLDVPQVITDSSCARQERGDALLALGETDPLTILADRHNADLPIYRDAPDDSDDENTMATVDMHVGPDAVRWQVYERPGEAAWLSLVDARLA
jgi:hypothetical protein